MWADHCKIRDFTGKSTKIQTGYFFYLKRPVHNQKDNQTAKIYETPNFWNSQIKRVGILGKKRKF